MLSPKLERQLTEHFHEEGRFSPFLYAIGLETSLRESEEALQEYPIPEPISSETITQFIRSLTFFHEASHLCQFVSSGYGLRTLRVTIVALKNLTRGKSWQLPIATSLFQRIKQLSPDEMRTLEGSLIFLDTIDQLRLHQFPYPFDPTQPPSIIVDSLPWSPHFFQLEDQGFESRQRFAKHLNGIGAHVRKLIRLTVNTRPQSYQLIVNGAALMESFAVVVEMNHIYNAFGASASEMLSLLPPGNQYHALTLYLLEKGLVSAETLILTMSVLIDGALMYDPFVLYNVPWDVADDEGRHEQYPGETFMMLCEALRTTAPIREATKKEIARFYKELCKKAGIPDPDWMAQKSYEVAETLLAKAPWEKALLGRALKAHRDALKFRCDSGSASFPLFLPTTKYINKLLGLALPTVSFYNIYTRQPEGFDPRKIDAITIHSILLQAISESRIDCPLKQGDPFLCESSILDPNKLCVFLVGNERYECLLDIVERQFGLSPSSS
jgi:hypothetical protein